MVFMNELTCMGNFYEKIYFLCKCISLYIITVNYIPHPYSLKRKRLRDELLFLGTTCIWLAQQSHFTVMSNFLPWSAFIKIASLRSTVQYIMKMQPSQLEFAYRAALRCHTLWARGCRTIRDFETRGISDLEEKAGELLDRGWRMKHMMGYAFNFHSLQSYPYTLMV